MEKRGCIDPQSKVGCKTRGQRGPGFDFVALPASLVYMGMLKSSLGMVLLWGNNQLYNGIKTKMSLNVSTTMVVMMVVHVLHRDPAPHADHKRFNLTLIVPTSNTEVAILSPVLSPRVGSNLKRKYITEIVKYSQRYYRCDLFQFKNAYGHIFAH